MMFYSISLAPLNAGLPGTTQWRFQNLPGFAVSGSEGTSGNEPTEGGPLMIAHFPTRSSKRANARL